MSRELERRLLKMEAKHNSESEIGKRVEQMTAAEAKAWQGVTFHMTRSPLRASASRIHSEA